jgi:hypothetical protein
MRGVAPSGSAELLRSVLDVATRPAGSRVVLAAAIDGEAHSQALNGSRLTPAGTTQLF